MTPERRFLEGDWYPGGIPGNVVVGADVYLDSAYGFAPARSLEDPAVVLGDACGAYDRATFVLGPHGRVTVGAYTVLNGTTLVCNRRITIGAHCLLAWGVVCTDTWLPADGTPSLESRRAALREAAAHTARQVPPLTPPRAVEIGENVWIGFDSVVLPGVHIGQGAIVGSKSVVAGDVPPYTVVVGAPARPVRRLDPDDTSEARRDAFARYQRAEGGFGNIRRRSRA